MSKILMLFVFAAIFWALSLAVWMYLGPFAGSLISVSGVFMGMLFRVAVEEAWG